MLVLMLATSCLISWLQEHGTGPLIGAGLALGTRLPDPLRGARARSCSLRTRRRWCPWSRAAGSRSARLAAAVNDVVLVAGTLRLHLRALGCHGKVLVGQWLPTFSSTYGNSAQVYSGADSIRSVTGSTVGETLHILSVRFRPAPFFLVVLVLTALVLAVRARILLALAAPSSSARCRPSTHRGDAARPPSAGCGSRSSSSRWPRSLPAPSWRRLARGARRWWRRATGPTVAPHAPDAIPPRSSATVAGRRQPGGLACRYRYAR